MQHLNEHTLAFYAMGSEFSSSEKSAIEAHLRECHGCRTQVEELRGIDQHVAEALESADQADDLPSDALVTFPRVMQRRRDAPPVRLQTRGLMRKGRFAALIRRHPIRIGSAGIVLAFLAFFSMNTVWTWLHKTDQPLFVKVNKLGTALEIYGKETKIFDIPVGLTGASPAEIEKNRILRTRIVDLDGDGNLEVITGSPYPQDGREVWNTLRIYSNTGDLLHAWSLGAPVQYDGVNYAASYGISGVIVTPSTGSSRKEILVGINNDRSPWCLLRLDETGKTLGEYWHFGWLNWLTAFNLDGVDHEVIVLSGENDRDYRGNNVFPMLTVVDPTKIVGKTESECTRGFGLPVSDAQLYYVRSENVNPALLSGAKVESPSFGYYLKVGPDSSLDVSQGFSLPADFPNVIYTFDKHLQVKDVWMSDIPRIALLNKFLAKKTPAGFNELMNDLKAKVRYWNGSQWTKEPMKIVHSSPPS